MQKALLVIMVLALSSLSFAEIHDVTIVDFSFMPSSMTITAGDTVRWTNQDAAPHTATSDNGVWDSGTLTTGNSYMRAFDDPGDFPYHCTIHPSMMASLTVNSATGINDPVDNQRPESFTLEGNYPNPFNASTTIKFASANEAHAKITVYDILGREVQVVFDGTVAAGEHSLIWDASKNASGVYFYRLTIGDKTETKAMTLLK